MIDVIVRSWNAVAYTKLTIASIQDTLKVPHQITVVDDGSNEQTITELEKIQEINLVRHHKNLGVAAVGITGYKLGKADYVLLIDNDIVVGEHWLEKLLPYFDDPKVALVTPLKINSLYTYPGEKISTREYWEKIKKDGVGKAPSKLLNSFLKNKNLQEFLDLVVDENKITDQELVCPPAFTSGCFLLTKRKLIDEVGGIAREMFTSLKYGGEDVDLCWRIGEAGLKVIKSCKVYAHHFEHSSMGADKQDISQHLSDSNQLLYNLWGEKVLSRAKVLRERFPEDQINSMFPFIRVMEEIKNHDTVRTF